MNSISRRIFYLTQCRVWYKSIPAIDDKPKRNKVLYNRNGFLFDVPCAAVMFCERNVKSRHSCLHTMEAINFDESINGSESIRPKSIPFGYAHMKMKWCMGFISRHLSSTKTMEYCEWNWPQNFNKKEHKLIWLMCAYGSSMYLVASLSHTACVMNSDFRAAELCRLIRKSTNKNST